MSLIDFILNVACLMLWLHWRATHVALSAKPPPLSLLSTLRRAEPAKATQWLALAALLGLLVVRALVYWWIGPGAGWVPKLALNIVALPFRSDLLGRMLLFSFLSFSLVLATLYVWLLLLSIVNCRVSDADVWQRMVRLQLGWLERWPLVLKSALPLTATTLAWVALAPLFHRLGIIPMPGSSHQSWQEGLVLGLAAYLLWKYVIAAVLLLYVVNSYVYLGTNPFWNYVDVTARHLLAPLHGLPLKFGRVDFSPLIVIATVFFIDEFSSRWLAVLYHRASG
jgi:uncharacterized protein YggT (Ycf19 family)